MSDINEYQRWSDSTAIYPKDSSLHYLALGLAGEAGEVANKVKKIIRDNSGNLSAAKAAEIMDELGDVMWYVSQMATLLRYPMSDVLAKNMAKLNARLAAGTIQGSGDSR